MNTQLADFPLLVLPRGACMAWTDQQVIYDDGLVRLTGRDPQINERREAMVGWLERHGIDSRHVPVPGWIVRDETNRCIVYWGSYGHGDDCRGCSDVLGHLRRVMVKQLEAPPLPFPLPYHSDLGPVTASLLTGWSP